MRGISTVGEALALDLALSEGVLRRWYGLSLEEVEGEGMVREVLGPGLRPVRFLVHEKAKDLSWDALRHLSGLAELRHRLGVKEDWKVNPKGLRDKPDALWQGMAVEYDAGYPMVEVREKLGRYETYPGQIWGVHAGARQHALLGLAAKMGIKNLVQVLEAPWG